MGEPIDYRIFHDEAEPSEYKPLVFSVYNLKWHWMMDNMGYDLKKKPSLNLGKGVRTLLSPFVPKGKDDGYYYGNRRKLGYVTLIQSDSDSDELVYSSSTLSWESDVSMVAIFKSFYAKMVSIRHSEDKEELELIQSDNNPWIRHLSTLWDAFSEQHEPTIDDKLTHVNLGGRS